MTLDATPPRHEAPEGLDAIAFQTDSEGRLTVLSASWTTVLGHEVGASLGRFLWSYIADVFNASDEQLMQSGGAVVFESSIVSPAGRRGTAINHKAAFVDDRGQVAGIIGSFVDITELKDAEARIARSEAFLNRVIDALPDPIFVKDAGHRFVKVNEAFTQLLGLSRDQIEGRSDPDFLSDAQTQENWADDDQVIGGGQDHVREVELTRPDAQRVILSVKKSAGRSIEDQPLVLGSMRDITELVASRDAAQAASRAKSGFLANMSHEIRTPLNGVIGIADLLLGTSLDAQQRHLVQTLQQDGGALMQVINDILDLSKIEAGNLLLQVQPFDPAQLVEEVVELFAERAQSAGLEITSDIEADVPHLIQGDAARLRQVLSNLVGNAIKFTPQGGVTVRLASPDRSNVRLEVRDSGIGIAPALHDRIFQAFTQAEEGASRRFGGTGLGLTISRDLVELLGGQLAVDSRLGEGACFHFDLPTRDPQPPVAARSEASSWHGRRALVVGEPSGEPGCLIRKLERLGVPARMMPSLEAAKACIQIEGGNDWIVFADGDALSLYGVGDGDGWTASLPRTDLILLVPLTQAPLANNVPLLRKPVSRQSLRACLERTCGTPAAAAQAQVQPMRPMSGCVLVVEDNPVNQFVATRIVKSLGCQVTLANNGREALERIAEARFDLVLMDCQMPEMDGLEATREIRRREAGLSPIPIVALTANAMESDRKSCLDAGMDDFLAKPFTREQLRAKISDTLHASQ